MPCTCTSCNPRISGAGRRTCLHVDSKRRLLHAGHGSSACWLAECWMQLCALCHLLRQLQERWVLALSLPCKQVTCGCRQGSHPSAKEHIKAGITAGPQPPGSESSSMPPCQRRRWHTLSGIAGAPELARCNPASPPRAAAACRRGCLWQARAALTPGVRSLC